MDPKDIRLALQGGLKGDDKPAVRAVLEIIVQYHEIGERGTMDSQDADQRAEWAGYMRGMNELAQAILKEVDQ